MVDIDKEKIRPLYSELQGLLSQAPKELRGAGIVDNAVHATILNHFNNVIEELNNVSGKNYKRFMTKTGEHTFPSIYRSKLGGLISRLHAEYFSVEQAPLSETPSTVISQTQKQSQSFQVQLLLEIQSKIDEKLQELEPEDKKRGFLEKVKGALTSVRNTAELIALILSTGQQFDLTIKELLELFK